MYVTIYKILSVLINVFSLYIIIIFLYCLFIKCLVFSIYPPKKIHKKYTNIKKIMHTKPHKTQMRIKTIKLSDRHQMIHDYIPMTDPPQKTV